MSPAQKSAAEVETLRHPADVTRRNIPTAETSALMEQAEAAAPPLLYPRNPDLDPQLVWRGKGAQDCEPLAVPTVPIYIQEKVLPEALIRDLHRQTRNGTAPQADLFGDFDRIADPEARLEFYAHAENWSNRMILGDSLLVMNSLAEKEGLRGQVQCIYLDPPYGIRFASNWQPSTRSRDVKEGKSEGLSREPEQIKAFRDTWRDGIHTYLSYLRDRLVVARELLTESGSIFVQIGDENVHRVRAVMDEVFGAGNVVAEIVFQKTGGQTSDFLAAVQDYVLWYANDITNSKYRQLFNAKVVGVGHGSGARYDQQNESGRAFQLTSLTSNRPPGSFPITFEGREFGPSGGFWKTGEAGFARLISASRIRQAGRTLRYVRFVDDFAAYPITNIWTDVAGSPSKTYVVQTSPVVIERCILMATDPGDLVLDPTCGSGTTAFVAEQWGRRWITIDTSRVALTLARTRLMAARHPAYLLRDSREGAAKEAGITGRPALDGPFASDIRQGFVLERVPHVTLKSIANNAEIDVIHETWQPRLDAALAVVNAVLGTQYREWEVPRRAPTVTAGLDPATHATGPHPTADARPAVDARIKSGHDGNDAQAALATFWALRRQRQAEMDASIARNAETEFLHDRPYPKKNAVRVTGPFTVESLSPHRVLPSSEEDEALLDALAEESGEPRPPRRRSRPRSEREAEGDFVTAVLDNLAKAGVQNTKKNERLSFATIRPWPGQGTVAAEATYVEGEQQRRAAIVIGPEYGTVGQDLVRAAVRECRDWADALVICGFAFDPQVGETTMNLGRLTVLKARMSHELHAADAYKAGGGNLFVVFGEPDIVLDRPAAGEWVVRLRGIDIFDPTTGEVRSSRKVEEDVACWFIDTDYDADSFFVRHAYFLGGKDPYEKLKAALKADVDEAAWSTLYATESRPFPTPASGRIAVKVINHYGDEAMRVFDVR